jgi:amino acid transporter
MRRMGALDVVGLFMFCFPAVAVAVLLGVAFGWQVPVGFVLGVGFILVVATRGRKKVGKPRAAMEFAGFGLLGGIVGGLLFGGLGAIFGFVLGFGARLPETTPGPSFRFLRRSTR